MRPLNTFRRSTTPLPERPFIPWLFTVAMARDFDEAGRGHPTFDRDIQFFQDHRDEWAAAYPNKWAAVYQHELICVCNTQKEVLDVLRDRGCPTGSTYIDLLRFWPAELIVPGEKTLPPLIFTEALDREHDKFRGPDLIARLRASVYGVPEGENAFWLTARFPVESWADLPRIP